MRTFVVDTHALVWFLANVVRQAPPTLDIHDSLIVGTALTQPVAEDGILTCNEAITASGLVPVIW